MDSAVRRFGRAGEGGQAVWEYAFTYGWVVVLVALAVAYLYWEGIILVDTDIKPYCSGFEHLTYISHALARDGTFSITLANRGTEPLIIRNVTVSRDDASWGWAGSRGLEVSGEREVAFGGVRLGGFRPGDSYRMRVRVVFERAGLSRTEGEECFGQVQREDRARAG